jgi:hypothetical protein
VPNFRRDWKIFLEMIGNNQPARQRLRAETIDLGDIYRR